MVKTGRVTARVTAKLPSLPGRSDSVRLSTKPPRGAPGKRTAHPVIIEGCPIYYPACDRASAPPSTLTERHRMAVIEHGDRRGATTPGCICRLAPGGTASYPPHFHAHAWVPDGKAWGLK